MELQPVSEYLNYRYKIIHQCESACNTITTSSNHLAVMKNVVNALDSDSLPNSITVITELVIISPIKYGGFTNTIIDFISKLDDNDLVITILPINRSKIWDDAENPICKSGFVRTRLLTSGFGDDVYIFVNNKAGNNLYEVLKVQYEEELNERSNNITYK